MAVRGRVKIPLTVDTLLQRVSEYDIYRYYLGYDFNLGKAMLSPFRKERNPSFVINITRSGNLHHTDYGDSSNRGGCIDFVMQILCMNLPSALRRIEEDMNLGWQEETPKREYSNPVAGMTKRERIFQVIERPFTRSELEYWNMFHIDKRELRDNEVYSIRRLIIDGRMHSLPNDEPVFAYRFDERWKIYRPLAKEKVSKWMGNVKGDTMSGLHRIVNGTKKAVVTKSKKDEILLAKFLPAVCSVQSENTSAINSTNIALLKGNCEETYLNFDSDEIGVQACRYYNQFGFGWINCPRRYVKPDGHVIKDFSDLARYYGMQDVIDHFTLKGLI
jgi:hypothetical protein